MSPAGAALAAAVAVVGLVVAVAGWRGLLPAMDGPVRLTSSTDLLVRVALAGVGFLLALVVSGWVIASAYVAFGAAAIPTMRRSKRARHEAVERVEAIATWTESLNDTVRSGAGLRKALVLSARVAPGLISEPVRRMAERVEHESVEAALGGLAADLADPAADTVIVSLMLAMRSPAGGLNEVLTSVARTARDAAAMRRRIEASRSRTYTQSRIVSGTSIVFILTLVVFRRDFLEPYDELAGQVAQLVVGAFFAVSGVAMYRLGRPEAAVRPFGRVQRVVGSGPAGVDQR